MIHILERRRYIVVVKKTNLRVQYKKREQTIQKGIQIDGIKTLTNTLLRTHLQMKK